MVANRGALHLLLVRAIFGGRKASVKFSRGGQFQHGVHAFAAQLRLDVIKQLGEEIFCPFLAVGFPQAERPELRTVAEREIAVAEFRVSQDTSQRLGISSFLNCLVL